MKPTPVFEPITPVQNRMIHASARRRAMAQENLYSLVKELIGFPSISALSRQEASCLIRRMETGQRDCDLRPRPEDRVPGDASRLANHRHITAIRRMARDLGWSRSHLKNWLRKYIKVETVGGLDREKARKAFLGLMQILRQQEKKAEKKGHHEIIAMLKAAEGASGTRR